MAEQPRSNHKAGDRTMRDSTGGDLLHGHKAIADHLGITERQAKHRCRAGQVPSFKMGHSVCGSRSALDAWLAGLARKPAE